MLLRLTRILLLAYLGFGAYLYFSQRNFIYYPTPEIQSSDVATEVIASDGEKLKTWIVNPGMDRAVVYFGGNAENVFYNSTDFASVLPGHSVYLVNYRGYGGSSGSPSESALYTDSMNIYDHLSSRHDQVAVIGRSLGSSIALYLASKRPVTRLILTTPYDSAVSVASEAYPVYPVSLLLKDRYENTRHAAETSAPALILIAENDRVISMQHSINLVNAFRSRQLQVVTIKQSGHNNISGKPGYWKEIARFLSH